MLEVICVTVNNEDLTEDDIPLNPYDLVEFNPVNNGNELTPSLEPVGAIDKSLASTAWRYINAYKNYTGSPLSKRLLDCSILDFGERLEISTKDQIKLSQLKSLAVRKFDSSHRNGYL